MSFKQPGLLERQQAAAKAKKAALEKFQAKTADPALAERLTARAARAAERKAIKQTREAEKAEQKAREAERARQAEHEAALEAERAAVAKGRARARAGSRTQGRQGRPLCRPQSTLEAPIAEVAKVIPFAPCSWAHH